MTKTILDANRIGTGTRFSSAEDNSDYLVKPNVIVASTNGGAAFNLTGSDHDLEVRGFVSGDLGAFIGDDGTDSGHGLIVTATGDLFGANLGAFLYGASQLENRGAIRGGLVAVYLNLSAGTTTITNDGLILGGNFGIIGAGQEGATIRLTNEGLIKGFAASYAGDVCIDLVTNRGVMAGSVDLSGGGDVFDNRGGRVQGTVFGSAGNDRFVAGAAVEAFDGGSERDTLDFRSGAGLRVSLSDASGTGWAEGDSYSGIERVWGSETGSDVLVGDGSGNTLVGFGGEDRLFGRQGFDWLKGGAGKDSLAGGLGDDVFEFASPDHGGDVISDFASADGEGDRIRIDASGFGGGLLAGVGVKGAQFDAQATNEAQTGSVRFIWETDAERLWFDRNGDDAGGPALIADLQDGATLVKEDIWLA